MMKSIYGKRMLDLEKKEGIYNEKIFDDEYSGEEDLEAINCMMEL